MAGLGALSGVMGGAGVVAAAVAVFLSGPPLLVRAARTLAVASIVLGAAGLVQNLLGNGFQLDMRGGAGQGSLLAAGGMLMLTFGAARAAERRRARLDRERWMAEQRAARK